MSCRAKTKGTGKPCQRPNGWGTDHPGTGRCKLHGGATPRGPASPNWKHGRYSTWAPARLRDRTEVLLQDPEILSLIPNLVLVDARITDILEGLDKGLTQSLSTAVTASRKVRTARATGNQQDLAEALTDLLDAIEDTGHLHESLGELWGLNEQRRRLVDSEVKRQAQESQTITIDRAMGLIGFLVDIIVRHVKDAEVVKRIVEDIERVQHMGRLMLPGTKDDK